MSAPYQFSELVATESVEARRVVLEFARETLEEQRKAWSSNRAGGRRNKPRPPTWEECLAKSIATRRRREVNDSYANRQLSRHNNL